MYVFNFAVFFSFVYFGLLLSPILFYLRALFLLLLYFYCVMFIFIKTNLFFAVILFLFRICLMFWCLSLSLSFYLYSYRHFMLNKNWNRGKTVLKTYIHTYTYNSNIFEETNKNKSSFLRHTPTGICVPLLGELSYAKWLYRYTYIFKKENKCKVVDDKISFFVYKHIYEL